MALARREDAVTRDRTTALLSPGLRVAGVIVARQEVVVAGIDAVRGLGPRVRLSRLARDGRRVRPGEVVAAFTGPAREIISAERVVLNLLGHLSGIATFTRRHVDALEPGTRTRILDTRKTLPGLRLLEKYAVRCGGGHNHRMDLSEMIFLKDNHLASLDFAALRRRLARRRDYLLVEIDRFDQIDDALSLDPDRILLDNMDDRQVKLAQTVIRARSRRRVAIEVSGGITLARIRSLSRLGVDFISIGSLTHSAPGADFSLEIRRRSRP